MRESVKLKTVSVRKPGGHRYTYWVLRWWGTDGTEHGQSLGRVDELSKRKAEKLRRKITSWSKRF